MVLTHEMAGFDSPHRHQGVVMKAELALQLTKSYPNLYRNYGKDAMVTCMAWGFECGDGWFELIKIWFMLMILIYNEYKKTKGK